MARFIVIFSLVLGAFIGSSVNLSADETPLDVSWLTVSDKSELEKTWSQSLVFLPDYFAEQSVKLLNVPDKLNRLVKTKAPGRKLPVILYLHSCEGLGHHREDLRRFAKLGFVTIGLDSFARDYRPLGCDEEREKFLSSFDLAVAFQKAELEYAIGRLKEFGWIDRKNLFLVGSGMGGLVAAHYAGDDFAGHVIEGWGCRGPNPVFDGIRAPENVRIFSAVSKNDRWYIKNPGFAVDCAHFLKDRAKSVSVVLERPAHYVSWYPNAYVALIRFLMRDMKADLEALLPDIPTVLKRSDNGIELKEKWSDDAVYSFARTHCEAFERRHRLVSEPHNQHYRFVCE